jgi:hypothetical protein
VPDTEGKTWLLTLDYTKEIIILGMTADVLNWEHGCRGREIIVLMCEKF